MINILFYLQKQFDKNEEKASKKTTTTTTNIKINIAYYKWLEIILQNKNKTKQQQKLYSLNSSLEVI